MHLAAEEYAYLVVYAYREVRVRDPNAGAQAIEDLLRDLLQGAGESVGRALEGRDLTQLLRVGDTRRENARQLLSFLILDRFRNWRDDMRRDSEPSARRLSGPIRQLSQAELEALNPANRILSDLDTLRSDYVASIVFSFLLINDVNRDDAMMYARAASHVLDIVGGVRDVAGAYAMRRRSAPRTMRERVEAPPSPPASQRSRTEAYGRRGNG